MRNIILLSCTAIFLSACGENNPLKTGCLNASLTMPNLSYLPYSFQSQVQTDPVQLQKNLVENCTAYLAELNASDSPSDKDKLPVFFQRAKAYTLLGAPERAHADIAAFEKLARQAGIIETNEYKRGIGVTIQTLQALSTDSNVAELTSLTKQHPYLQSLHEIAFSYAVERGDYEVAAELLTLPTKLGGDNSLKMVRGTLFEMAENTAKAISYYEQVESSLDSQIKLVYLYLKEGNVSKARKIHLKARQTAKLMEANRADTIAKAVSYKEAVKNGKILSTSLKKRMTILNLVMDFEATGNEAVYADLMKMGSKFGHYELVQALQYIANNSETRPANAAHIMSLDAKPSFSSSVAVKKLRASAIEKMPRYIPGSKLIGGRSGYSSKVWLLKSTGFSHKKLEDGSYQVTFEGSVETTRSVIVEMSLLRAAEVLQKQGASYFDVVNLDHYNKIQTVNGMQSGGPIAYSVKTKVRAVAEPTAHSFSIDVVLRDLLPLYKS